MLGDEKKTPVSTHENKNENSCENRSFKKKKNITHLSEVMTFSKKGVGGKHDMFSVACTIIGLLKAGN
jgi:hypothetical protein